MIVIFMTLVTFTFIICLGYSYVFYKIRDRIIEERFNKNLDVYKDIINSRYFWNRERRLCRLKDELVLQLKFDKKISNEQREKITTLIRMIDNWLV